MKRAAFMLSVVPAGLFAMLFSAAAHALSLIHISEPTRPY